MLLRYAFGCALLVGSSAQLPEQCNTKQKQRSPTCQAVCDCDCASTSGQSIGCSEVCQLPNGVQTLPWCKQLELPTGVELEADVLFMVAYGANFTLDIYTNTSTHDDQPLALIVHGGSFSGGDKANVAAIAAKFAARGFRAININYPLCKDVYLDSTGELRPWDTVEPRGAASDTTHCSGIAAGKDGLPAEVKATLPMIASRAVRMAIQYMHTGGRAAKYQVDTKRSVCHGNSAGAITCYLAWLFNTSVVTAQEPPVTVPVNAPWPDPVLDQYGINVAASRAGGFDNMHMVTQETVNAMAPGAAVWDLHGDADTTVHLNMSNALMAIAQIWGIPHEQVVIEDGGHDISSYLGGSNDPDGVVIEGMFAFIWANLLNASTMSTCTDDDAAIIHFASDIGQTVTGCSDPKVKAKCSMETVKVTCCKSCTPSPTTSATTSAPVTANPTTTVNACTDDDTAITQLALKHGESVTGCSDPQVAKVSTCAFVQVDAACCETCAAVNQDNSNTNAKAYGMGNPFAIEPTVVTNDAVFATTGVTACVFATVAIFSVL